MENFNIEETDIWAYISGNSDPSVKQKVEEWMNSENYDAELFAKINSIHKLTGKPASISSIDLEKEKSRFFESVEAKKESKYNIRGFLKYAAVIAILCVSSVFVFQKISIETINIETTYAELKQIDLPDGSKIWLNSKSKISYKETSPRTIYLEGEAFFDVTKDEEHPFTVETPENTIVKALGTSFNIKAYPESVYYETVLFTGKVEVSSKDYLKKKKLLLDPNDRIIIDKKTGELQRSTMEQKEVVSSWKEHKIQFKNKTFKEIAEDFELQYNVKINFENEEIANSKFTGKFDKTTPIDEILEILQTTKYFDYQLKKEINEWIIK